MTFWDDLMQDIDDDDLEDLEDLDDLEELDDGEDEPPGGVRVTIVDDDDDDDDLTGDDLERSVYLNCPYCGREVEHVVDPGGGTHQVYVEDCEVCCQPWEVTVRIEDGIPWATAKALDE